MVVATAEVMAAMADGAVWEALEDGVDLEAGAGVVWVWEAGATLDLEAWVSNFFYIFGIETYGY